MRIGILVLILMATLVGSGYWYSATQGMCRTPVHYRIGNIDSRFSTSREELKRIALQAELLWEGKLNKELFVYDEAAEFPIHLIFDERQENAERETELREDLEAKEGMSETVQAQYERLIGEFRSLKKNYESRVVSYESDLKEYNKTVTEWNSKGGAPQGVVTELNETQRELSEEQKELETLAQKLNNIVADLNRIGARGNSLITDYNTIVEKYNKEFSEATEFTQGEYRRDAIEIYQFDSEEELTIVLAHEFGHALALDHVTNEESIMYHLMGAQTMTSGISPEDVAEFNRQCKDQSLPMLVVSGITKLLNKEK